MARRTYAFVLTYLLLLTCWMSLALGAARAVDRAAARAGTGVLRRRPQVVALLAFARRAYAGYIVLAIGIGRARRTQFNWVVTGRGAP